MARSNITPAARHAAEARRRRLAQVRKSPAPVHVSDRKPLVLAPSLPAEYSLVGLTEPGFAAVLEREAARVTAEHKHSFRKPAAKYGLAEGTKRCSCGETREPASV